MAVAGPTRGCMGIVRVAAAASGLTSTGALVGSLTNWSFEETSEQIDASTMGTCTKAFVAGAKATTGTFDVLWDGDNGVQAIMSVGSTIHFRIYPEGTASTANFYKTGTGGATVLSVSRSGGGVDGIVQSTFGWAVNGQLTATAV